MAMGGNGAGRAAGRGRMGQSWDTREAGAENPAGEVVGGRASRELRFPTLGTSSVVPLDSAYKTQI